MNIRVIDDFVKDPARYRDRAVSSVFGSVPADGGKVFHGISHVNQNFDFAVDSLRKLFPEAMPCVSFFRKSPMYQVEPNDIHSDEEMGDWTGILYLNSQPDPEDGTVFWRHAQTGKTEGSEWKADGHQRDRWHEVCRVPSRLNRLLLFSAPLFHSRAMVDNYGHYDDARLIQVIFGKGVIPWQ